MVCQKAHFRGHFHFPSENVQGAKPVLFADNINLSNIKDEFDLRHKVVMLERVINMVQKMAL
jgi:hypothetical protein